MRINNTKLLIVLAAIFFIALIAPFPLLQTTKATVPSINDWTAQTAMAHWDIIDVAHGNVTIGIDATYVHQPTESTGKTDMIYVKVTHVPQGASTAIGYMANITSGPTWSMDRVYINATLAFNWTTGGLMNHPITIEWLTAPQPVTYNKYTTLNGSQVDAKGVWRSGTGNTANATMIIGGTGPHPSKYNSTWALVGASSLQTTTPLEISAYCDVTIMSGQSWYFFAHSTGGIGSHTYQWYEGTTKLSDQTSMVLVATKAAVGTYTYTCIITDAIGSNASSNTIRLTVI